MEGEGMDLDNKNMIANLDNHDALWVMAKSINQLDFLAEIINEESILSVPINNVVVSGMGGSCLGGLIAKQWLDYGYQFPIPFEVVNDYYLPNYVNESSLVICVSVSGNTEETLSAYEDAMNRGAQIAVISSGGKLISIAERAGQPFIKLDKISQPRYGIIMHLRALCQILYQYGIIDERPFQELEHTKPVLNDFISDLTPDIPINLNPAKQLAEFVAGKTVLGYSSRLFSPLVYKWKTSFNENAKNTFWCNHFPEFNHNEFVGWTSHPVEKPFAILNLRSNLDNPRIGERFDLTEKLLSGYRPAAMDLILSGNNYIEQTLCGAVLGDFSSIYLGLLNGVDPTPVELVEKFKKQLS